MLLLPHVIERTWGDRLGSEWTRESFWTEAIPAVRERHPGFVFMAEAYWDLEWELQQQGFDFTYDKTLYDRLRSGDVAGVRAHLEAAPIPDAGALPRNPRKPRAAAPSACPTVSGPRSHLPRPPCACSRSPSRDGGSGVRALGAG